MGKKLFREETYMNFKFAKTLLMGSVMTMGAFGLVACGDDSSSGSGPDVPETPIISASSTQDISIKTNNLGSNSRGDEVRFQGTFEVKLDADTTNMAADMNFSAMQFEVAKGAVIPGGSYTPIEGIVSVANPAVGGKLVDLSAMGMGVTVNLANPALTECGDYTLIVKAIVTDTDGKNKESNQYITFNRDPGYYCKSTEPESSSSEPVVEESPLATCTVELSTNLAPGLNLATCTAADAATADVVFSKSGDGDINFKSANGMKFGTLVEDSYSVGYWPEGNNGKAAAYKSDFKYRGINLDGASNMIESADKIYVAQNAAGAFYAFGFAEEDSYAEGNNKDFTFTIKVYHQ